ncbi:hypothetical protein IscW_ISCW002431 [Ixodes scapularis]|uniref:Uncharacterized protein n=1 Tax=Ixodes scapularis TaxID=6945 RepID=B7PDF4_IXOSC|nr:hypothetical protein IscW_ISCW002431 [Ixodes scapularis]|eukprot:XP_002410788.1 hypothetical protein IscW_ISCW002431 [Ixodes scapularis]
MIEGRFAWPQGQTRTNDDRHKSSSPWGCRNSYHSFLTLKVVLHSFKVKPELHPFCATLKCSSY